MKKQLKNYLLLSKINFGFINKQKFMLLFICLQTSIITAQIANYISNGSFEDKYSCSGPSYLLNSIKYWRGIDSINYGTSSALFLFLLFLLLTLIALLSRTRNCRLSNDCQLQWNHWFLLLFYPEKGIWTTGYGQKNRQ